MATKDELARGIGVKRRGVGVEGDHAARLSLLPGNPPNPPPPPRCRNAAEGSEHDGVPTAKISRRDELPGREPARANALSLADCFPAFTPPPPTPDDDDVTPMPPTTDVISEEGGESLPDAPPPPTPAPLPFLVIVAVAIVVAVVVVNDAAMVVPLPSIWFTNARNAGRTLPR